MDVKHLYAATVNTVKEMVQPMAAPFLIVSISIKLA